ncbi:MAG: hypothetical protein DRO18_06850, partial [Thermoprotei archaeon]
MKFPYTTFRRGQKESIERIAKRLGSTIVLKAPTGFGKTIVAILSHIKAPKVLYVVRTRNEMAPVVRELKAVNEGFTIVFSGRRMCPILRNVGIEPEDFWINCRLLREKGLCPYYERLNKVSSSSVERVLRTSGIDPHEIVANIANKLGICPFFALSRLINNSKFIVATYPYLFKEEVFRTAFSDDLSEYYVIIDEAHTLLNIQSLYEEVLSEPDVEAALRDVRTYSLGKDFIDYLIKLRDLISRIKSKMLKKVEKAYVYPGEGLIQLMEDDIIELRLKKLKEMIDARNLINISTKLTKIVKFLKYVKDENFEVYGHLDIDGSRKLRILPTSYNLVRDRLKMPKGLLLMSGTMPRKDIVDKILECDSYYIDVEEDYGRIFPHYNIFYAVYTAVTSSFRKRSIAEYIKYAELLKGVFNTVNKGVILALYPSYEFMDNVVSHIENDVTMISEGPKTSFAEVVNEVFS